MYLPDRGLNKEEDKMKTFIRLGIFFGLAIFISGCNVNAKTAIESFKDPDFQNLTINKILISTKDMGLFKDRKIEKAFADKFAKYTTVEAVPQTDLFFPTRTYSDTEKKDLLVQSQVDEILEISQTDFREDKEYIPGEAFKTGHVHHSGHPTIHTRITFYSQGHYASKPVVTFKLTITTPDNKTIWLATAETTGTVNADMDDLIDSLSDETIKQLAKDGLVTVKKTAKGKE